MVALDIGMQCQCNVKVSPGLYTCPHTPHEPEERTGEFLLLRSSHPCRRFHRQIALITQLAAGPTKLPTVQTQISAELYITNRRPFITFKVVFIQVRGLFRLRAATVIIETCFRTSLVSWCAVSIKGCDNRAFISIVGQADYPSSLLQK